MSSASPFGPLSANPLFGGGGSPLSVGGDPLEGFTGFGFDIPQGDPGAIAAAGRDISQVGLAFEQQGRSLAAGARIAVDADGGWSGTASGAYASASGRLSSTLHGNAAACRDAAKALQTLSTALSHAQSVTKQALADCEKAHGEIVRQQGIADEAGQQAMRASEAATSPGVHPGVAASLNHEAHVAGQASLAASAAVGRAQTALDHAKTRGHNAYQSYMHEAQGLRGQIASAAGELRTAQSVGGPVDIPITPSTSDIILANALANKLASGQIKGPLMNAVPASERTPGVIAALLAYERQDIDSAMEQGGAKGPYGPWTNDQFLNPDSVNSMVAKGLLPAKPANWGSMSDPQRQQYLKALGPFFTGLTCFPNGGGCSFVKATGTGTRSVPEVLHTLSRWGEYTAVGVCVAGSDGACIGAVRVAFVADTASNVANASSPVNFLAREGVTGAETVVAGGGGIIASELGKSGMLERALPSSTLGRTALKVYFTTPSGVVTVIEPRIDHNLFPDSGAGHGPK